MRRMQQCLFTRIHGEHRHEVVGFIEVSNNVVPQARRKDEQEVWRIERCYKIEDASILALNECLVFLPA